jgi:RHS repeat-associated protein
MLLNELNNFDLRYAFDDFGRKNQTTSPDTGATKYEYDEAGNLTKRVDANGTTVNYTYDALNRLTSIDFPGTSEDVAFTYDSTSVTYGKGRLTGRTDPSGSYAFYYDAQGNLTKEEKTISSVLYTTEYAYNNDNNLTSITSPGGREVSYTLDVTGKVTGVDTTLNSNPKPLGSSITYLPYGGITGLTYGNNLSLSQGYDNQYRSSTIVIDSVLDRTYEYDANGNITSVDDGEAAGNEALESAGIYAYDQGTNLLDYIWGPLSVVYDYDNNANTVSANNRTYVYDSSNQLIEVWDDTNQIAGYTYNGAGQRIKKWTSSETRIFHYDLKGHLIAETSQGGAMIAEYVYVGDQLLAMITKPVETEISSYFHNDHLGTPQVLTNDSQTIVWKAAYTPFGRAEISIQTVENQFRQPGQFYDPETGLHYNYFRYYDATTGRYITPDPIGLAGGINPYDYVANNPINWTDFFGLAKEKGWRLDLYDHHQKKAGPHFTSPEGHRYDAETLQPIKHKETPPELSKTALKDLQESAAWQKWLRIQKNRAKGSQATICEPKTKAKGKGPRGSGTLGAFSYILTILDVIEASQRAEETGKSVWEIMIEDMGYSSPHASDNVI